MPLISLKKDKLCNQSLSFRINILNYSGLRSVLLALDFSILSLE
jgi:hypothetical protein